MSLTIKTSNVESVALMFSAKDVAKLLQCQRQARQQHDSDKDVCRSPLNSARWSVGREGTLKTGSRQAARKSRSLARLNYNGTLSADNCWTGERLWQVLRRIKTVGNESLFFSQDGQAENAFASGQIHAKSWRTAGNAEP